MNLLSSVAAAGVVGLVGAAGMISAINRLHLVPGLLEVVGIDYSGELDQTNIGESDGRTIYKQGREPLHVNFCSLTVNGTLDNDILQEQIHDVVRQREELQHMETELRAQMIARTEMIEMKNSFDTQLKECSNAVSKLQAWAKQDLLREQNKELATFSIDYRRYKTSRSIRKMVSGING